MSIDFRSDNTHGCSPEIVEALTRAASGTATSYGGDDFTARLRKRCRDLFETDLEILPLGTGTGANSLAIAAMTPPWGAVFCHEEEHVHRDQMGAPEFFTGGAKLFPIAGRGGKVAPADLDHWIDTVGREGRTAVPACVSLTQATEAGAVYGVEEMKALGEVARARKVGVHVDGARFANAVAALGCSPADLTWRAGVAVLIFGATKNGAMGSELMVVFRKELVPALTTRIHRAGHRFSKMRFLSAQFEAYLENDLWLRNARRANETAARLAAGLRLVPGVEILHPVEANILFVRLPLPKAQSLRDRGILFYEMPLYGEGVVRLVTGFGTTDADVDALLAEVR